MTNKEISRALRLAGQLMELHGENSFKVRAMQNAAFKTERFPEPLEKLDTATLATVDGIGKGLAAKIIELNERGSFTELDELVARTPGGVAEMLSIKGIGPKKVAALWQELGIESVGELLYACHENRLVELKGFGAKTQEQVRHAIEYAQSNKGKFHYAVAEMIGTQLLHDLESANLITACSFTGAMRRKCEIIESIDIIVDSNGTAAVQGFLHTHPLIDGRSVTVKDKIVYAKSVSGIPLNLHCTDAASYNKLLFETTAAPAHLEMLRTENNWNGEVANDEHNLYQSLGLPYIEPELREGLFEFEWAKAGKMPELVSYSDLRGTLHNHSTYSDGVHSLEEMALYCKNMGYGYLGICDHSQSAFYANGLKPDRVLKQHEEIDRLNKQLAPFRIFKGIESDILVNGSLDYENDLLAAFDFIVASVHSVLRMDESKATARLISAIENPHTTILGHPTGRLLLAREGYPLDFKKIIDACAANGVIIELNANPYRLDLDWRHIPYALEKGVQISINPDAHRQEGIHDMHYGVCTARKGGLSKEMTFNALDTSAIAAHFEKRRK